MKKILIVGTGGTIIAQKVKGSWQPGKITVKNLLKFVPEIKKIAEIETIELFQIDSSNMQPRYWVKIAQTIYENRENYDGVVIIHGTDTMHYTASALSFLLQHLPYPVVLTGAQVPCHQIGSDARRNLIDGIRVAAETDIGEVVIVFDGKIFRGNRAKKFRELEFRAFESVGMQPLGVIEHDIRLTGEYIRKSQSEMKLFNKIEPDVYLIKLFPGFNPGLINEIIKKGCKGIVIEGYGSGNVPIGDNSLIPMIAKCVVENIPVVLSTQCAIGCSWVYLYECGKKALEAGAIAGFDMLSETTLTKLMWALGNFGKKEIPRIINSNIAGEISANRLANKKPIRDLELG